VFDLKNKIQLNIQMVVRIMRILVWINFLLNSQTTVRVMQDLIWKKC